jgi:RNA-directed DNA polymerase
LLAITYLHYVFDLWVEAWRKKCARGRVIVVRYVDDTVMGFEHREESERFLRDLGERMRKFGLELHPNKTRLIEFGRHAARNRKQRGERNPKTFDFLGFTHLCGKTSKRGHFMVLRKTVGKRIRAKLRLDQAATPGPQARPGSADWRVAADGGPRLLQLSRSSW